MTAAEPTGPLVDAVRDLLDVVANGGRPGAQARLEAAQAGDDPGLLAAVGDAAAELAATAMSLRISYTAAEAHQVAAVDEAEPDRPPLHIHADPGGELGRAALRAAGVLVADDAPLRIADVVALDHPADEHRPAERVVACALLINPRTPLQPASVAMWLRRQADAIDR